MDAQIYYAVGIKEDHSIITQACDDPKSALTSAIRFMDDGCVIGCVRDAQQKVWALTKRQGEEYTTLKLGDIVDIKSKTSDWAYRCKVQSLDATHFSALLTNIYNPEKKWILSINPD